jgi:hypothetical protein
MRHSILVLLISSLSACGGLSAENPTPPPIPEQPDSLIKADGTCRYACSTYHFATNQCDLGWQCDAQGQCLTYVGTPDAPNACPPPPPPPAAADGEIVPASELGTHIAGGRCEWSDTIVGPTGPRPTPSSAGSYDETVTFRFVTAELIEIVGHQDSLDAKGGWLNWPDFSTISIMLSGGVGSGSYHFSDYYIDHGSWNNVEVTASVHDGIVELHAAEERSSTGGAEAHSWKTDCTVTQSF